MGVYVYLNVFWGYRIKRPKKEDCKYVEDERIIYTEDISSGTFYPLFVVGKWLAKQLPCSSSGIDNDFLYHKPLTDEDMIHIKNQLKLVEKDYPGLDIRDHMELILHFEFL